MNTNLILLLQLQFYKFISNFRPQKHPITKPFEPSLLDDDKTISD